MAKNSFVAEVTFNKHVALQNLTIYYMPKNIKQQYKNKKLKTITPRWNQEFELLGGSYPVSDIQDYIEYIIKKTLNGNPPIHIYTNRINNKLVFKIKDGYKFELQTPETMNLFDSPKKIRDKTKNGKNILVLKQLK